MNAEERLQSLVDSKQGLCLYISITPALLSLLYDIDRMPEQWIKKQDGPEWRQIALISHAWCVREKEHAEAVKATRREEMEKCVGIVQGQTTINMGEVQLLHRVELDILASIGESKP